MAFVVEFGSREWNRLNQPFNFKAFATVRTTLRVISFILFLVLFYFVYGDVLHFETI
jgi:hypothetical protein